MKFEKFTVKAREAIADTYVRVGDPDFGFSRGTGSSSRKGPRVSYRNSHLL